MKCMYKTLQDGYSFFFAFCHRSHNVFCFVLPSCCTTAGSDRIDLLPNTFIRARPINRYCIVYTFVRTDLLYTYYGRSGIGAEKPILTLTLSYYIPGINGIRGILTGRNDGHGRTGW